MQLIFKVVCECGGEMCPIKKDKLPLLSMCNQCRKSGPFWSDVVRLRRVGEHGSSAIDLLREFIRDDEIYANAPITIYPQALYDEARRLLAKIDEGK